MTETTKTLSIIVPVLNEEGTINELIDHLHDSDREGKTEIIVVDGDPGGSTIAALRHRDVYVMVSRKGRALQMNAGAHIAHGDILLFLHADTFLPPHAINRILMTIADGRYSAGAFDLGFSTKRKLFRITERYVHIRSRLTRIPFGDQAIFMRRDYFNRIGGFKDIPIMEDMEIMKRIRDRGDRVHILPEKVMTSSRRYEQEGVLYCTFRNLMLQSLYSFGVKPERLVRWYRQRTA